MTGKSKRNALSMVEMSKLIDWLRAHHETANDVEHAAKLATLSLGFTVVENNIVTAEECAGVKVKRARASSKAGEISSTNKDRSSIVALCLIQLLNKLNEPVPKQLQQVASRSSITDQGAQQ